MNKEIAAVARGLKCVGFGAYGLNPIAFASHAAEFTISSASSLSWFRRWASASPLMPPPERKRKSRLDQHVLQVETRFSLSLGRRQDRKSTRLNSSHSQISYAVFCLKKKKTRKAAHSDATH